MPLLSEDQQQNYELGLGQRGSLPAQQPDLAPEPGLAGAAFRRGNLFGTMYERTQNAKPDDTPEPNYDPLEHIQGYEDRAEMFIHAHNPASVEWVKQQADRENKDNEIIATHHGYGLAATMAAGLVDPVTLASMAIPVGGEARLATMARSAVVTAATSAAQIAAQHSLEVTPSDFKTDALNVAGSAVLGGTLGAIFHHVPAGRLSELSERVNTELHGAGGEAVSGPIDGKARIFAEDKLPKEMENVPPLHLPEERADVATGETGAQAAGERPGAESVSDDELLKAMESPAVRPMPMAPSAISDVPEPELHTNLSGSQDFGAAGVKDGPTLRGMDIARGAQTADKVAGFVSPASRVGRSPSLVAKQVLQELVNLPGLREENYHGIATGPLGGPVETNLWKREGVNWEGMDARDKAYQTYRSRTIKEGGQPLSQGAFGQEISKAMRRGDSHAIPEVAQAAKDTRRIVFEPDKQEAIKYGLLPPDVKASGADSYLMRQYDHVKIRSNQTDWMNRIVNYMVQKQGVDVAEARDIAHQVTRNVTGSERGTMDWKMGDGIVPKSGRLKERTLHIPDEVLEPYLNNDIDVLSHSYLRSMGPEVEMTKRFGSRDMKDQMSAIHDDYARMIEQAGTDDAKKKALSERMDADLRDIGGMRDVLYGIKGQPKDPGSFGVRAGRLLRAENGWRLLGGGTLAHFPDIAQIVMRYGAGNTISTMGKLLVSSGARDLTQSTAKRLGVGTDLSMARVSSWFRSATGDMESHSQFPEQRIAQSIVSKFLVATGETPLITGIQQLASTMAQDEIIRSAQRVKAGQPLAKNVMAKWAAAGLDQDALGRIADMHEKFGADVTGLKFGMSDKWDDKEIAGAFESAVARESHGVTLRPGAGDLPLMGHTEWFKMLRQFTTFGYAAQRSVVNPILQGLVHGDHRAVQGLMALVAAGSLSYISKQIAAGQPIEDPASGRFALEVLDKSNLMGWTGEYIFPALWGMGFDNLSRWQDRNATETVFGPTAGTLASVYTQRLPAKFKASAENDLGMNDDTGDQPGVNRADLHFMRRLMPWQNHWLFRNVINHTEDAIGDAFDLPGQSIKDRREATMAENQQ